MSCSIAFVIFPGFQQLDLAGPMAAFELAERALPGSYTWRLVAGPRGRDGAGGVPSSARVAWPAQGLPRRLEQVDLVMVIGGDGVDAAGADPVLTRWLRAAAQLAPRQARAASKPAHRARITSICSGSLVLAAAGLLQGRAATTHWSRERQFASQHPGVELKGDRIFVHEPARPARRGQTGKPELWTSAGMTAGIDLCLALISHDHGEALAREVARQLVVERRRPGGQTQFSTLLDLQPPDGRFGTLLDAVRQRLHEPWDVAQLAALACMSPRHFARLFVAETGTSPAQAVERLRVQAARAALEDGAASVQRVATTMGFGNAERMRRAFVRLLGRPPAQLRRAKAHA